MKKLFFVILTLLLQQVSYSQSPAFEWAKQIEGRLYENVHSVAVDTAGNVYAIGRFTDTVDFDPGPGVFRLVTAGNDDAFILKLDSAGNFVWAYRFGGKSQEVGEDIAVDAAGNIYVTGCFRDTVDFDPGPGIHNVVSAGNNKDAFVLKLDASCNLLWAEQLGGDFDHGFNIKVDAAGYVYTSGFFSGTGDFDPGPGTFYLTSHSVATDIFVSKLDANGNFVWAAGMGGKASDSGVGDLDVDAAGNVYTAGYFSDTADFDPGPGIFTLIAKATNDAFFSKLDANGNFVWAISVGGTSANISAGGASSDIGYGIAADALGNVYTTGYFAGTADFDPGPGVFNLSTTYTENIFITKLDSSGNLIWAKQLQGLYHSYGYAITLDTSANVYIAGGFDGPVDFDPGPGTFTLATNGTIDPFISKLDSAGNFVWAAQMAGGGHEFAMSIAVDRPGNVYSTGHFYNTVDFDPGSGIYNLTSTSSVDGFVHKMSQCTLPSSPVNTTTAVNQSICANNATVLSVTGTGTVNWYQLFQDTTILATGAVYTTPVLGTGTYTYYAAATNGCAESPRIPVTFTVNPNPAITATTSDSLICSGQSATLTASGGNTYTWDTIGTGTSIVVSPVVTSSYTVVGVDTNGCSDTAVVLQHVNDCTAISQYESQGAQLSVYPNPAPGSFTVELAATAQIVITDVLGKVVVNELATGGRHNFSLQHQPSGVYFVRTIRNNGQQCIRLIKE